jgi:hypothetical protein
VGGRPRSDSDVAREMQQAFDNETNPSTSTTEPPPALGLCEGGGDRVSHFTLYHYNGLVGPGQHIQR